MASVHTQMDDSSYMPLVTCKALNRDEVEDLQIEDSEALCNLLEDAADVRIRICIVCISRR